MLLPLWSKRTAETEKPAREFVSLEGTNSIGWLAQRILRRSIRTTGYSIKRDPTGPGCRTTRLTCSRTTNPISHSIPSGRPLSALTSPGH